MIMKVMKLDALKVFAMKILTAEIFLIYGSNNQ